MISLRNAVVIMLVLASALSACSSICEAQERIIGRIIRVRAPAEIYKSDLKISIDAVKGEALSPGDTLRTGSSGLVAVVFPDGSQIVLQKNSAVLFRRRDLLTVTEGQVLAEMRGERMFTISTPEGEAIARDGQAQALITVNKPEENTYVSVFSGDVTLANTMGKVRIFAQRKAIISRLVMPHPVGDIGEKEYDATIEWADFDAPSIIVLIQQTSLGEDHSGGYATAEIEKILSQRHFQVVTSESIKGYGESQIQELARKGMQGDISAMRELAGKLQVELIMTGRVKTTLLGEVGRGIVSCGAHGVLKVYEAKSGELLLTREGNTTSIQRNPPLAGADATEKLITTFSGTISWDIMQSLAENLPPSQELNHIQLDVLGCSDKDRKTIIDRLKTIREVKKTTAGLVEKGKLSINLYTTATAKTLAGMLERSEIGILKIVAIKGDRITAKTVKKK
ncbi:MAG: FecR family protein [Vulcanimicrobiota bacterium]